MNETADLSVYETMGAGHRVNQSDGSPLRSDASHSLSSALTVGIPTTPFGDSVALLRAGWGFHTVVIYWPDRPRSLKCRAHVVQADHLTATPVLRFQKCIPPWPLLNSFVSLQDFLPVISAGVLRRPRTVALSYLLGQSSVTLSNSNGRRSFAECSFSSRISPTTRE